MKRYNMTFNVLKSSYFLRYSGNLTYSKCKEKSQQFLQFGIALASVSQITVKDTARVTDIF